MYQGVAVAAPDQVTVVLEVSRSNHQVDALIEHLLRDKLLLDDLENDELVSQQLHDSLYRAHLLAFFRLYTLLFFGISLTIFILFVSWHLLQVVSLLDHLDRFIATHVDASSAVADELIVDVDYVPELEGDDWILRLHGILDVSLNHARVKDHHLLLYEGV